MNNEHDGTKIIGTYLAGSVPLADAEAVFRTAAETIGPELRRMPDGETGERVKWVTWQSKLFAGSDAFALVNDAAEYSAAPMFHLRDGVSRDEIELGPLGYAAVASSSYATFARLKQEGAIPAHVRFQVSLPTPVAVVAPLIAPDDRAAVEPRYAQALDAELARICDAIPADELSIQWDVAVEFAILEEAVFRGWWEDPKSALYSRLVDLGNRVPEPVELGYHLCYGDASHKHFVEPRDTALLVEVANTVLTGVERPVQFLHLPVPRDRTDDDFFAPLERLELPPETELYLGLVHMTDGLEGAAARIAAARRYVKRFGVAAECGFGRRPPESVVPLLELHKAVVHS